MDRLWAPWRLSYVASAKPPTEHDPCFICRGLAEKKDRDNLIAWRGSRASRCSIVFPTTTAICWSPPTPTRGNCTSWTPTKSCKMQQTIARLVGVTRDLMKPDGFNIGLNLGRAAGAGLPGHLHWHIVPRWTGDTNYHDGAADTRVIVQSLEQFYIVDAASVASDLDCHVGDAL